MTIVEARELINAVKELLAIPMPDNSREYSLACAYDSPDKVRKHMRKLVKYLYDTEKKHWEESDKPKNHIFESIQVIEQYLKEKPYATIQRKDMVHDSRDH